MKLIKLSFALLLALAIGGAVPAMAQHDRDDDHHGRDRDDDRGPGNGHGRGHAYGHYKDRGHDDWDDHHREGHYVRYVEYRGHHRIPEDHFRAHFGRDHRFVVRTVVVEGRPRFQYDGYWFVVARPMPRGWHEDEPVYVDYIDDHYYVCSPAHPGVHISVDIL